MSDFGLFLGKFLRHGTAIASIAPSSPWLARTTISGIDWDRARVVLELGAGTGPITHALAQRAPEGCRILAVERDPDFVARLRDRFAARSNVEIVAADVRDLASILAERQVEQVDEIVSGLPVPSFPKDLQRTLFRGVKSILREGGGYHQITELPLVYWGLYRRYFAEVAFLFEPRNLPPAGAYRCRGLKPGI